MLRFKLTIAYVGTDFCGWQTQARPDGQLPTIQTAVMRAVRRITGTDVHVHGAGRTDSGVHADAQIAHMDVPDDKADVDWQMALNTGLPPTIRIMRAEIVPPDFHAQRSAIRKTYLYRLWTSVRYTPPQLYPFVWSCGPLDLSRMDAAACYLRGTQDFAAVRNRGTDVESTVRTVSTVCRTDGYTPSVAGLLPEAPHLVIWKFEADGFLKQMVRNMMGLLVRVGQGKIVPDTIPALLASRDRRHNGTTAPACGLTLHKVWYAADSA